MCVCVPRQFEKAKHWYEKAAELGDAASAYALGGLYENRFFDETAAMKWCEAHAKTFGELVRRFHY